MSAKIKKLDDQRAPVIRYDGIKELWSLDINYFSVAQLLSSLAELYDNVYFLFILTQEENLQERLLILSYHLKAFKCERQYLPGIFRY